VPSSDHSHTELEDVFKDDSTEEGDAEFNAVKTKQIGAELVEHHGPYFCPLWGGVFSPLKS
jgi:hypothetical protein